MPMTNKSFNYISKTICFLNVFLKCRKNTESKNLVKTKNRRMFLSKCGVCDSKKSKFVKEQEARGLLSKLTGSKVPIANVLL